MLRLRSAWLGAKSTEPGAQGKVLGAQSKENRMQILENYLCGSLLFSAVLGG